MNKPIEQWKFLGDALKRFQLPLHYEHAHQVLGEVIASLDLELDSFTQKQKEDAAECIRIVIEQSVIRGIDIGMDDRGN